MAHPSKFVSVNLNKSYGQPPSSSTTSSAFGNGRARPGTTAGGSGMVVLSRPRSSGSAGQKGPPKVSVPPPLNLPSLRKEHERFNPASVLGSSSRPGSSGFGSGTGSSTMGWTKPGLPSLSEDKDGGAPLGRSGGQRVASPYMPPGGRVAGQPAASSSPAVAMEKAVVLRGEEFPSLQATVTAGPKQRDASTQKQRQKQSDEEVSYGRTERLELQSPLDMRPQMRSSRLATNSAPESLSRQSGAPEQSPKQDRYFPGLLPLVRLSHTSDWADDERDTGLSIPVRDRVRGGFSRTDSARVHDVSDGRGARVVEGGSVASREFFKGESFGRDLTTPGKDGRDVSSWRTPQARDGFSFRETGVGSDRTGAKSSGVSGQISKEGSYGHLPNVDSARGFSNGGAQDIRYNRRDLGSGTHIQNGRNATDTFNGRVSDQTIRGRFGEYSNNRNGGDVFQNNRISKSPFSSGSKGFSLNDPIMNFGREKRLISNSRKPYIEGAGLDISDPFSGGLIGDVNVKVLKRKKDVLSQVDFHDPVRESFEAELERVQRMQELERQRVMEEQARALDLARREHEERERRVREEEERRRRLEEEAREAAWRAEQETLETAKRAEEQRVAREEEKRRILMEEERRKEAARQKLMELEARIAKRQVEATLKDDILHYAVGDERMTESQEERDVLRLAEWKDDERMVECSSSTAASDSSSLNRFFDTGSRPQSSRDGSSLLMERGNHANNWRREAYDNGNNSLFLLQDQDNDYHSSRRDAFNFGRGYSRKEIHSNLGPSVRPSSKGGASEPSQMPDDYRHARGNRWNIAGDGDYFNRNSDIDVEFLDNDKFGDGMLGPGRSRGSPHSPYAERSYQNSEVDGFSPFGRSRHLLRQPRVLPPPSISSMHKSPVRAATERLGSSSFLDSEMRYQRAVRSDEASYDRAYHERLQQLGTTVSPVENNIPSEQKEDTNSLRCDSQSSLSVSSPPSSPTHLSHDDLDESEEPQLLPTSDIGEHTVLSENEHIMSSLTIGNTNTVLTSSSASLGEDDEWATENHETMQEPEEYDEDDDGYHEEEEAHEVNGENLDIGQEFEDVQSDVPDTTGEVDQVVLGFDEGVEVRIPISDEFETIEKAIGVRTGSVGAAQELVSSGGHRLEADNAFPVGNLDESSEIINETEKALQELVLDPEASTSSSPDSVEETSNLGMPAQQPVSSHLSSPMQSTSSVHSILSPLSAVPRQPEVPVKLQFGLFSGPPLIPSPVPAIQIGSIQMPLHLHPHIGPSTAQMHSSQPPFFQFGQLRYTSPISQGILPLAPQSMSFIQPPASSHYTSNQNLEGAVHNETSQECPSLNNKGDKVVSAPILINKQPGPGMKALDLSQDNIECRQINASPDPQKDQLASLGQTGSSSLGEVKSTNGSASASQAERGSIRDTALKRNYRPMANNKGPRFHSGHNSSQFFLGENALGGSKAAGIGSGSRGKRFAHAVRNTGSRSFFSGPETSLTESSGFRVQRGARRNIRRMEFRVRESVHRRQTETESFNYAGQDGKPNSNLKVSGNSARDGGKKDAVSSKSTKIMIESEYVNSGASTSRVMILDGKMDKFSGKEAVSKKHTSSLQNSHAGKGNFKRNGSSEEEDAPLQSGVVRVFKQSGIEAPSDEDDFIQVRSKRQMLNDRREQREKEIKAKSRVTKAPRKHRAVPHFNADTYNSNKAVASRAGDTTDNVHSESVISDGKHSATVETSPVLIANVASQSLPPIGTPAVVVDLDTRSRSFKSGQRRSVPAMSSHGTKFVPGFSFENKNGAFDNASMPCSWDNGDINQQVIALTQSQLDESMLSAQFDSHATSSIADDSNKPPTSIMMQEKLFSSSATPLNSLLAGEKIQFGAVTSPTILPPVRRPVSTGIGPPGSGRSDVVITPTLPAEENDCSVFFNKVKYPDESCAHLEDPEAEAEAEAAASAVAVAAISNNDEIVGNGLSVDSVSVSDPKSLSCSDSAMLTSGALATASQGVAGQSAAEGSLVVALPADLSVDTSPLPLWPPLPSPQSSPGTMLSHFPAAPPSHFPCFEMNPMLGGPIFAFGPHDESAGTQAQPQRSTTLGPGPLGAWPQCHSTADSFYGPAAGFAGPFISPGGIPSVQGPPHMLVYNHFTPVGQFGQVGLSFMGTTYIPTGKQPDWKHNPVSSAAGVNEGDINNLNIVSGQCNPPSIPAPIQHMAPGSPLMPMASPLTMFDMTPFQASADMPLQAHWSHIPAPPIHSVPLSLPLHQHQVDIIPSRFSRSLHVDTSDGNSRFNEPRSSVATDGNRSLSVLKDAASQLPHELGPVEPPTARSDGVQKIGPLCSPASGNDNKGSRRSTVANASGSGGIGTVGHSFKPRAPLQQASSGQQYLHPIGYSDQRGGASQKTGSGGEWHRRTGYQGRNQTSGPDKNFASPKVKQIYVAKSPAGGTSTTG